MSIILKYLITFFVGMVPILELRGAIPIGVGLGLSYFVALSEILYLYILLLSILDLYLIFLEDGNLLRLS